MPFGSAAVEVCVEVVVVSLPVVQAAATTATVRASRTRRRMRMAAESIRAGSEQRVGLVLFPRPRVEDQGWPRFLGEVEGVREIARERLPDGRPRVGP